MRKLQLKKGAEEVAITNGDFRRTFKRAEQPFEVEDEVAEMLTSTGQFEAAKPAQQQSSQQQPQSGGTNGNQ